MTYVVPDSTSSLLLNDEVKLDLRNTVIKPKCSKWLIEAWQELKRDEEKYILNGWKNVNNTVEEFLQLDQNDLAAI